MEKLGLDCPGAMPDGPESRNYTDGGGIPMDQLFSPWRFAYVTTADGAPRPGVPKSLSAWPGDHA